MIQIPKPCKTLGMMSKATMGNSDQLLNALAGGRRTAEDVELVWAAAQLWVENGCNQPLHRFLRLPPTPGKLTDATRNLWLRRAALMIRTDPAGPSAPARALRQELDAFISRGAWRVWCKLESPPPEASNLRKALFYVAKFNNGSSLSERQIYRILT